MTTRRIVLSAKYAYEALAIKDGIDAIGWDNEPSEIKEGWYKVAQHWQDAMQKADEDIRGSRRHSKGPPRAK